MLSLPQVPIPLNLQQHTYTLTPTAPMPPNTCMAGWTKDTNNRCLGGVFWWPMMEPGMFCYAILESEHGVQGWGLRCQYTLPKAK